MYNVDKSLATLKQLLHLAVVLLVQSGSAQHELSHLKSAQASCVHLESSNPLADQILYLQDADSVRARHPTLTDEDFRHRPDRGQVSLLVLPQAAQEVQEEIVSVEKNREKKPLVIKNSGIWLRYDSR